jgi:hypothetical protein
VLDVHAAAGVTGTTVRGGAGCASVGAAAPFSTNVSTKASEGEAKSIASDRTPGRCAIMSVS